MQCYATCNSQRLGAVPQPTSRVVIQLDKIEVKVIGVLKYVHIQLIIDPRIQDIIDIHVVEILEIYEMLLTKECTKCLRGWFSTNFTQLWLAWKGLNNQIKIDVEPKLKTIIMEYNAPNKVLFNQSNLSSYWLMTFKWGDTLEDSQIGGVQ